MSVEVVVFSNSLSFVYLNKFLFLKIIVFGVNVFPVRADKLTLIVFKLIGKDTVVFG